LLRKFGKDHLGGVMLMAMGIAVLIAGVGYRMGSLNQMGAGFVPVVLGALMLLVGLAIFVTATPRHLQAVGTHGPFKPEWRGWLCILGGVIGFVTVGTYGGMVPATFVAVFVSAMGDRNNTWRSAAALGAAVTVFGVVVFHYGLSLQLPLFAWG
jgi:hypothetical protein